MCKERVQEKGEISEWKRIDHGINLYCPDAENQRTSTQRESAPYDLNERVAEEMKKDIFLYFRHYSFERGPSIWRDLETPESKKSHWWTEMEFKFSEWRKKWLRRLTSKTANDSTSVYNNGCVCDK